MDISSYTAASTIPKKIIINPNIIKNVMEHNIRPVHVQLNPTNDCPLNCSYCSCKNRNKSAVMGINCAKKLIHDFKVLGTEAITITGGGDPLAHPQINEIIDYIYELGIDIGLVTNGLLFHKMTPSSISKLTWCRISVSDEQILYKKILNNVIKCDVDWAFSYVLSDGGKNIDNLTACVKYANEMNFTHVRIVDDILNINADSNEQGSIKKLLQEYQIDDSRVIYQGRKQYTKGHKRCLIGLLKPNIDPEKNMFSCCGIMYSKKNSSLDFDKDFIMNKTESIQDIYRTQSFFDGSVCDKCYYSDYNEVLNMLWDGNKTKHQSFI